MNKIENWERGGFWHISAPFVPVLNPNKLDSRDGKCIWCQNYTRIHPELHYKVHYKNLEHPAPVWSNHKAIIYVNSAIPLRSLLLNFLLLCLQPNSETGSKGHHHSSRCTTRAGIKFFYDNIELSWLKGWNHLPGRYRLQMYCLHTSSAL